MTPTDRNPRALVLTADRTARQTLSDALRRRGFDVAVAADGASGLALLLETLLSLDVVIADLELPARDGLSLLRLVRVAGGERELALVLRCPRLPAEDAATLRALGADALVGASDGAEAIAAVADEASAARAWAGGPTALAAA